MSPLYHELRNGLLAVCDEREAHAIALAVLEEVFGVARIDVYADKVRHFSDEERLHLQNILCRLQENTPLQYITGYAAFCGRRFEVSDAVLIPRPETEELVAAALESTPRRLLDVGTGSGCIAISLALALPRSSVEAWDLSADALEVARRNARRLGAEVGWGRTWNANPPTLAKRSVPTWNAAYRTTNRTWRSSYPTTIPCASTAP